MSNIVSDNATPHFDIFLSHSHLDADVVEALGARLADEGGLSGLAG
jgi:hypothetical protein